MSRKVATPRKGSEEDCELANRDVSNSGLNFQERCALHMFYEEGNAFDVFGVRDTHNAFW